MRLHHIFIALLVVAVWGFNYVELHLGLVQMPPLMLCTVRFFLTSIPLVFFIKRPAVPFALVALYGFFIFVLQMAALLVGMHVGMTPGMASLLLQVQVFFSILFAAIYIGEFPDMWQIIGALVSFGGITLVAMHLNAEVTAPGFILLMIAAASWGAGNLISKKIGHTNMVGLIVWSSMASWPLLFIAAFIFEGPASMLAGLHFNLVSTIAILYIVFASTIFGFATWSWLLNHYSMPTVAPFALLVPVFGMLSSVLFLGEQMYMWKLVAMLLVIAGLGINLLGPYFTFARRLRFEEEY